MATGDCPLRPSHKAMTRLQKTDPVHASRAVQIAASTTAPARPAERESARATLAAARQQTQNHRRPGGDGHRRIRSPCRHDVSLGSIRRGRPWRAAVTGLTASAGTNPGEIDVTWNAQPESAENYRVSLAPDGENFRGPSDSDWNASPTTNSLTITGLQDGSSYRVKVRKPIG